MKHKWVIVIMVAMMLMTGCGNDDTAPIADVTPSPAQHKQMLMDAAFERGETIFVYDVEQTTQYALYYGANHIIYLKPHNVRPIKLTSSECINLSVRKRVDDGDGDYDWTTVYSFQHVGIGDYVLFDGTWRVTQYNGGQ